jgi:hypothetical protein
MALALIEPNEPGWEQRTFECQNCGHTQIGCRNQVDRFIVPIANRLRLLVAISVAFQKSGGRRGGSP